MSTAIAGLATAAALLKRGLQNLDNFTDTSLASLWRLRFGQIDPRSLIASYPRNSRDSRGALGNPSVVLVLANLPQLLISLLHLNYKSIFTCMLMEKEWNDSAYIRKRLRVSSPSKGQRSTYFLSLPYRYAIPLIVLSGSMHWVLSQSFFLAQINPNGMEVATFTTIVRSWGYSCIGIVFILILGCLMLLTVLLVGLRRLRPGIPFAGHCSAVLSAACQRSPEDEEITSFPIKWGVIGDGDVRHCTFSSSKVHLPEEGVLYR